MSSSPAAVVVQDSLVQSMNFYFMYFLWRMEFLYFLCFFRVVTLNILLASKFIPGSVSYLSKTLNKLRIIVEIIVELGKFWPIQAKIWLTCMKNLTKLCLNLTSVMSIAKSAKWFFSGTNICWVSLKNASFLVNKSFSIMALKLKKIPAQMAILAHYS